MPQRRKFKLAFLVCDANHLPPCMQADSAHSDSFIKFLAWVQVNQKRLTLWGVIIIAVVAIGIFLINYQTQKEVRASIALSSVPVSVNPIAPLPPGTADAYLKVAREHAGTKAASRALLNAGSTLFTEGKYADAHKTFEQFVREYPDSPWVPQAHYGIGSSLDVQGKASEATTKFEEIRKRYGSDAVSDDVKLALGRLYENQNKPAEAHKIYTELLQTHEANPYSGIGNEAGMRKVDLETKFPELARTNAPIMSTPPLAVTPTNATTATNRVITLSNIVTKAATNLQTTATNLLRATTNVPLLIEPGTNTGTK